MQDTNPYAAPESTIGDVRARRASPQRLSQAIQHGAWVGLKWTTFIVGPVAILFQLAVLAIVFDRGWQSLTDKRTWVILFAPLGFYLTFCLWVGVLGAILASVPYLSRRNRPEKGD